MEDYTFVRLINSGAYASVKLYTHPEFGEVAIKTISIGKFRPTEITVLLRLKGFPGVLQYLHHFKDRKNVYIVTEYFEGKELFELSRSPMDSPIVKHIYSQLLMIMIMVHKWGIIHRDLKPENVLVNDNHDVLIIDWGLAYHTTGRERYDTCGTLDYYSPEMVKGKYIGPEIDAWCLGAILYEMLTGEFPFNGNKEILRCNVDYSHPNLTPGAIDLLSKILVVKNRASLYDILYHKWLSKN